MSHEVKVAPCAALCRKTQADLCTWLPHWTKSPSPRILLCLTLTSQRKPSHLGLFMFSTYRVEALIKCLPPFMVLTSLTHSFHSRDGRSIASATAVSAEEHFHRMGWPLKRFKSVLAERMGLAALLGN